MLIYLFMCQKETYLCKNGINSTLPVLFGIMSCATSVLSEPLSKRSEFTMHASCLPCLTSCPIERVHQGKIDKKSNILIELPTTAVQTVQPGKDVAS